MLAPPALVLAPHTPRPCQGPQGPQRLLPEVALAAPACFRATNVLLLATIPVPVFLLLQTLEQQLVGEASQRGSGRSCGLPLTLQVDVAGRALQGPWGGQTTGAGQPPPLCIAGGFPEWNWRAGTQVRLRAAREVTASSWFAWASQILKLKSYVRGTASVPSRPGQWAAQSRPVKAGKSLGKKSESPCQTLRAAQSSLCRRTQRCRRSTALATNGVEANRCG